MGNVEDFLLVPGILRELPVVVAPRVVLGPRDLPLYLHWLSEECPSCGPELLDLRVGNAMVDDLEEPEPRCGIGNFADDFSGGRFVAARKIENRDLRHDPILPAR